MSTLQELEKRIPVAGDVGFSQEQIDIIRSQVAPEGTTRDELALFLQYCTRTGLDPFARQIYLSERRSQDRNGNWIVTRKPETTIDGFRLLAERSGQYAGQLGPFWCGEDGLWVDVWTPQAAPVAARVGILRHDFKEPLWAVALYDEYVQMAGKEPNKRPNSMWAKMPSNQLAKCAESLGLRRAFPRELAGLYTKEEMPDPKEEGKEAQKDYLASKGLEPYTAPPKSDVRTASDQHKALILETAKMLDDPPRAPDAFPQGTKPLEMRSAAQVAEAAEALQYVAKPAKTRKITADSIEIRKGFGNMKEMLLAVTGTTDIYYDCLRSHGYASSADIPTKEEGRRIYLQMGGIHKGLVEEKKLRAELELVEHVYHDQFYNVMGTHGCEVIEDALALTSEPLEALRRDLKKLGGAA